MRVTGSRSSPSTTSQLKIHRKSLAVDTQSWTTYSAIRTPWLKLWRANEKVKEKNGKGNENGMRPRDGRMRCDQVWWKIDAPGAMHAMRPKSAKFS